MTAEQAAAVARVREALAKDTDGAFYSECGDEATMRAVLAALDAELDAAQAPREVPRLTKEAVFSDDGIMSANASAGLRFWHLIPLVRAVESRVRELCGVKP